MTSEDTLLEHYPVDLLESLARRDRWRDQASAQHGGLEFLVSDLARWTPGSTVTVAFLDGSNLLHRSIADATRPISEACNLTLDFGYDRSTGSFRRWTTHDVDYAADIRVSFDLSGYWSLVGTAAIDPSVGAAHGASGGRANQRTLNFGGYDIELPPTWRRTVLHEFLHALAFKHEHQNMRGPCQHEFRWDDDPGYVSTQVDERFVTDSEGRRPGIYTYLSGAPNRWDRAKVDHNLRSAGAEDAAAGPFDPESVMLYRFPALFYRTNPSPCAPIGDGERLSDGDRRGLQLLYPDGQDATEALSSSVAATLKALDEYEMTSGLESLGQVDYVSTSRALLEHLSHEPIDGPTRV